MSLSYWGSYECVGGLIWFVLNYDGPTSQSPLRMEAITCRQLQTTFHNLPLMIFGFLNVILGLIDDKAAYWFKEIFYIMT